MCKVEPYLNLFKHFGYRLTVKFLTGLFIGREDFFHRHIMSCKSEERKKLKGYRSLFSAFLSFSSRQTDNSHKRKSDSRENAMKEKLTSQVQEFMTDFMIA